jgi:probable rRNA maturation factor
LPARLELTVTFAARRPWAPRRADFLRWAGAALAGAAVADGASRPGVFRGGVRRVTMSVRVVGTARSRSLNARYRDKDRPTNVLSFGGAGRMPDGSTDLGELVICAPIVAREASAQGKRVAAHWAHLTVHGALHLLGFDHESPREARKMEARETQILDRLGFSNPYVWPGA